MIRFSRWFNRLYAILVRLYPSDFRDEFGEEITSVCTEAITEAAATGPARLALVCLREFLGLLLSLARENWRYKMGANDDDNLQKTVWLLYPGWVVLSTVSIPVAWVISWAIISQLERVIGDTIQIRGQTGVLTEDFLFGYFFPLAAGLVTGCLQYLLLRRHLPRMGWWIPVTTFGWSLAFIVDNLGYTTLYNDLDVYSIWFEMLMSTSVGGCIGLAQWLVLRQRVPHAAWWILANVLGWGIVGLVQHAGKNTSIPPALLAWGLLMPAIATGAALWLLLNKLPQREVEAT